MWTLNKRNQRKMQVMDIKFYMNIDGKTRRVIIRNEILRKGVKVQNLLTELKERRIRWFGNEKRMDETKRARGALELIFK
jgi:hypothetical protein